MIHSLVNNVVFRSRQVNSLRNYTHQAIYRLFYNNYGFKCFIKTSLSPPLSGKKLDVFHQRPSLFSSMFNDWVLIIMCPAPGTPSKINYYKPHIKVFLPQIDTTKTLGSVGLECYQFSFFFRPSYKPDDLNN